MLGAFCPVQLRVPESATGISGCQVPYGSVVRIKSAISVAAYFDYVSDF
jgi:hypothetical protein